MPLPDLVLVHGGAHAGDCWDLTVSELRRQEPKLRILAVDLPGRGSKPGDLTAATIGAWVDSVVADIDDAGFGEIVIAGHSMAGVTVPGVVARLGSARVREMVLAAAFVPRQGEAITDTLDGPMAWFARRGVGKRKAMKIPAFLARYAFCNEMTEKQRRFMMARLYPETISIATEPVDRSDFPANVSRTWILTTRDRALSIASQRRSIDALGGVHTIVEVDSCHDMMISHPNRTAQVLLDRCRRYDASVG
ncbi:alpha/beta fold hydrolase [Mycobacterium sp. E3247]|uniref:alpha/beta fold hydrolase n=1 Tax=Mycobacterium sp. E3247 TaxID=1856864 RepID=UPI0007FE095F|nr:alpha/beta hydrolase [Mycobacterium sp. E3247]OBH14992.1 esterase [Mycobacterium sp. E3247]